MVYYYYDKRISLVRVWGARCFIYNEAMWSKQRSLPTAEDEEVWYSVNWLRILGGTNAYLMLVCMN